MNIHTQVIIRFKNGSIFPKQSAYFKSFIKKTLKKHIYFSNYIYITSIL